MLVRTIFLTLALLSGMGTAKAEIAAPKAIAEQQYWDFGRVESGTALEHRFALRNTGSAPLRIENVQISGKGLKIRVPRSIPPGKTANVIAYIDTRSVIGLWKWRIALQTNDKTKRVVSYSIRAFVYSPLEIDPLQLYFSLYDDETATKTVTVTNHKPAPLAIKGVEKKGNHFTAALSTLEAGRKYRLQVTVPKSVGPGRYREAVRLLTDNPEHPVVQIGVNVFVKRDIYVFPESVSFGRVAAQRIKNPKIRELLTETLLVKKRAGDFAITGIETNVPFLSISRTPSGRAGSFKIEVGLKPQNLKVGPFDGAILIRTDDPRFPVLKVPVRGAIR